MSTGPMYQRATGSAAIPDRLSDAVPPGRRTLTQRMARGAAPPALASDPAPGEALVQQHQAQERGLAEAMGFFDAPTPIVQRRSAAVGAVGDASEIHADAVAAAVVRGESAEALLDAPVAAPHAIARKAKNTVITPDQRPPAAGPDTIPPPNGEITHDAEGNVIAQTDEGRWYLTEEPRGKFPHIKGKHELYPINPVAAYQGLMARVRALGKQQAATAARLQGANDMKYWFCHVYARVTQHEIEQIESGGVYQYPHMKLQEVIAFAEGYAANLAAWESGAKDKVEKHWLAAFAAAESETDGSWLAIEAQEIGHAMIPSMEAHIKVDLPRAIASCYLQHYAGIPGTSLEDFYKDFDAMMPVFTMATEDLRPEIEAKMLELNPGRIDALSDAFFKFWYLNVDEERKKTWKRADLLTEVSAENRTSIVEYQQPVTVDGTAIVGSDWDPMTNQAGRARPDAPGPGPAYAPAPPCPKFPSKLIFKKGLPRGGENLEKVIEDDQDLAPYVALAQWTREVRGAAVLMLGRASAEGDTGDNANLAASRADLVKLFLTREGADFDANAVRAGSSGELFSDPNNREQRCVLISVGGEATSRQQYTPDNPMLPGEVPAASRRRSK